MFTILIKHYFLLDDENNTYDKNFGKLKIKTKIK